MSFRDFGLVVLVCLVWAANNLISKYVVSTMGVPPLFYAGLRFVVVLACVLPWLLPAPRPLWRLLVVALLMGALNFGAVFIGLKLSHASAAAVVLQLAMPMTILLSMGLLGERVQLRRGVGMALTFAGVLAVIWDPHGMAVSTGLLFVAAAAFFSSLGAVLMKQLEGVKPLQYQAWVGFTSVGPLLGLSAVLEPGQAEKAIAAGWPFAAAVVFSGLVVSLFAHSVYYVLVRRYEANLVSALTLLNPLFTIAMGVGILGDPFGPRMAIGSLMAVAGVLIMAFRGAEVWALLFAWRNRGA
jgi:O-acetylserine/cysteine efflux transporter